MDERANHTRPCCGTWRGWVGEVRRHSYPENEGARLGFGAVNPKGYADALIRICNDHYKRKAAALARPL